ncbi:MAG TPA: hypothetical protein VII56_10180 [Rhizomicrobium sp.]
MTKSLLLILSAICLSGCGSDDRVFANRYMMLESEDCRSTAVAQLTNKGGVEKLTSDDKLAAYDRSYRVCMLAKGY